MGRALGDGLDLGVGVGRGVGVGEIVAVGVEVGVAVAVALGVGVASDWKGAWISTATGAPVLKKAMFAVLVAGAAGESNRKLYSVPQRTALAFWFCAKVSQFQVVDWVPCMKVQGSLL